MTNIILHCSASGFGNASMIDQWHRERGWSGNGYHLVILNGYLQKDIYNKNYDGLVETGRPLNGNDLIDPFEVGAHARGHNKSVGICLIGNSGQFTRKQMSSLYKWLRILDKQFTGIMVYQHSEMDKNKPFCAGLGESEMNEIKEIFNEYQGYSD
jgi:N-acetylmuramoyl-L-alanine amidase